MWVRRHSPAESRTPCALIRAWTLVGIALAITPLAWGCYEGPVTLGQGCENDAECSAGQDCYRKVCVAVCGPGEGCPAGSTCVEFRCLDISSKTPRSTPGRGDTPTKAANTEKKRARARPAADSLPVPDPVEAELRAIRVELETIRRQQAELLERLR